MDIFQTLGVVRRCYFTDEELKTLYHQRAQELHPDSVHGDTGEFVHLNAAYRKLLDPAERLRALACLEFASASWSENTLPSRVDLFELTARILEEAKQWLTKIQSTTSSIIRSSLLADRDDILSEMEDAYANIEHWQSELTAQLKEMDRDINKKTPERLSVLAADFTYSRRWLKRLHDQKFQLSSF